ncbi:hypothetical protein MJO28_011959 [Puccinia striiformis f. sp. tritici]|uniref:Uncharacterized protein n=1 Tax=Puccinia striiformis f. sp. tritici TaxID=168172 RepID=A0ACC0DZ33_9BASI|nr:hypothetical protein MJO28_011959 [Puccinia striiformis f. sp. tritici]
MVYVAQQPEKSAPPQLGSRRTPEGSDRPALSAQKLVSSHLNPSAMSLTNVFPKGCLTFTLIALSIILYLGQVQGDGTAEKCDLHFAEIDPGNEFGNHACRYTSCYLPDGKTSWALLKFDRCHGPRQPGSLTLEAQSYTRMDDGIHMAESVTGTVYICPNDGANKDQMIGCTDCRKN